ncbi:MAG: hypothetical protein NTU63_01920 [Candidatus Pacearchaeota archaeon]|nr:hypothetical protein [Candidatus Pacearchaeota archaeon]
MIIQTYNELRFYLNMFKNGNADLLIIESKAGLAKSRLIGEIMQEKECLMIFAHTTPLRLYMEAYLHKDLPIVIDDVDSLLQDNNNLSLLKMLCNTDEFKEISWFSTSPILENNNIPSKYETKSRVAIICNRFDELTEKISALRDRGIFIQFQPTNEEILAKMREIIPEIHQDISIEEKTQVYSIIEKYANVCEVSLRTLVKGIALYKECRERGIDWQSILLSSLELNPKLVLLDKILRDYEREADRIKAWEENGYSKRNYYEFKLKLNAKVRSPLINLHEDSSSKVVSSLAQSILKA